MSTALDNFDMNNMYGIRMITLQSGFKGLTLAYNDKLFRPSSPDLYIYVNESGLHCLR